MEIQRILLASIIAGASLWQAHASTKITMAEVLSGALRRTASTKAIDCVPQHIREANDNAAIRQMIDNSRRAFFELDRVWMIRDEMPAEGVFNVRFSDYDLNKTISRAKVETTRVERLIKTTGSVNFLSLNQPFSAASFALLKHLSGKKRPNPADQRRHLIANVVKEHGIRAKDEHKLAFHPELRTYLWQQNLEGHGGPIKQSLENPIVVLMSESYKDEYDRLRALYEQLQLPYTMMFVSIFPEEAYWMGNKESSIVSIHNGQLPNQLIIFQGGYQTFSTEFGMSSTLRPDEDLFVWDIIENFHNCYRCNYPMPTIQFPEIKEDQWGWAFKSSNLEGRIKKSNATSGEPVWLIESEERGWNRYSETYPRLASGDEALKLKQKQ